MIKDCRDSLLSTTTNSVSSQLTVADKQANKFVFRLLFGSQAIFLDFQVFFPESCSESDLNSYLSVPVVLGTVHII